MREQIPKGRQILEVYTDDESVAAIIDAINNGDYDDARLSNEDIYTLWSSPDVTPAQYQQIIELDTEVMLRNRTERRREAAQITVLGRGLVACIESVEKIFGKR